MGSARAEQEVRERRVEEEVEEEGHEKKKCCFLNRFSLHETELFCPQCSCLQSSLHFDRFQHSTVLTVVLAGARTDQLSPSTDTLFNPPTPHTHSL